MASKKEVKGQGHWTFHAPLPSKDAKGQQGHSTFHAPATMNSDPKLDGCLTAVQQYLEALSCLCGAGMEIVFLRKEKIYILYVKSIFKRTLLLVMEFACISA